jgi:hypothetical protein
MALQRKTDRSSGTLMNGGGRGQTHKGIATYGAVSTSHGSTGRAIRQAFFRSRHRRLESAWA